ncbi:MAG: hypothetical protein QOH41_2544 [Blastocatellia bacterium]|nr:hypothetical protein [Blastocatellia bacterium]
MPTRKKSSKPTKASRKSYSRKGPKKALPPPDDPMQRHQETSLDLNVVLDPQSTSAASASFINATTRASRKKPKKTPTTNIEGVVEAGDRDISQLAQLRLAALEQSRGMPHIDNGAPMLMAAAIAGAPQPVAPVVGASNWIQLGPTAIPKGQTYGGGRVLVTGRVTSIVVDPTAPNTIYCATAQGGVWKTINGGISWVPTSDNEVSLAIGALAIDPSNHLVLYAGTGEGNFSGDSYYGNGVLKTTNGGASWAALAMPTFAGTRFSRIAVTPGTSTRLFAATGTGVYRSTNAGVNWSLMSSGTPAGAMATDVVVDSTTPTTVYAAFWGQGIYKCTNAAAGTPSWTKLTSGLPGGTFTRIALGISPSSPLTVYALIADNAYTVNGFFRTTNGGNSWSAIALPGGSIGAQGFYNLNVAVDPTTPDIVYLSGVSLWKATRNTTTGVWTISDIGGGFHPDNHALAFDPTNHLKIYAGSDGGIYQSTNGGASWDDSINEGLCIMQCEFIDQHPTSDAVLFSGTQDNGTEQFRNSPVFNHADDGDGGYCAVDKTQPRNVLSTYYGNSPKRSTLGGKFGTWMSVSTGIAGSGLFYPPLAMDETNSNHVAFGTDRINLDPAQGTNSPPWPTKVTLPGMSGNVSAIHYTNSNLIYAGTTTGKVYRLVQSGGTWTATAIHAGPLPAGPFITDMAAVPGSPNTIIVVMSGFGHGHVWRGVVPAAGATTWTNISGSGVTGIPDIPANAVVIDPGAVNTFYIATDVAVYRTINGGASWVQFSEGLPNCAVFDLRLHTPSGLLRAGTHGRGVWERKVNVLSVSSVDLYFRDHLMSTGRILPTPEPVLAGFEDLLQYVNLGDPLYHWMCADIKVDALEGSPPAFQMLASAVDYLAFETKLQHRNAQRGNVNRAYVKVNNRGFAPGSNVVVKLLWADASAGLPALPPDFWTAFPNNSTNTTAWHPLLKGAATFQTITTLSPTEPSVLEWDFPLPATAATHSCLLAVMDCPGDPIPAGNKIFDVDNLVRNEKRVGLKNLHVVNIPPSTTMWTTLDLFSLSGAANSIRAIGVGQSDGGVGFLLPKTAQPAASSKSSKKAGTKSAAAAAANLDGLVLKKPTDQMIKSLKELLPNDAANLDVTRLYDLDKGAKGGGVVSGIKIPKAGLRVAVLLTAPSKADAADTFSVVQEEDGKIVGGSTYVVRAAKQ